MKRRVTCARAEAARMLLLTALMMLPRHCIAGDLTGQVLDDKGKPVSNATVTIHRVSVDGPLGTTEGYFRTSDKGGAFSVAGLAAGPFIVCAVASGTDLVDPCQWGTPAIVRVPVAGAVSGTVQLQRGATVTVHFDDPQQILSIVPPGTAGPARLVVAGTWNGRGHFREAVRVASDAAGRDDRIVVPADTELSFAVLAQNLTVADSAGIPVDSKKRLALKLSPGQKVSLRYGVSGKK